MKLFVDTSRTKFRVSMLAAEKVDQNGKQKFERITNEPLWTVQLSTLDESGGGAINVTLAGQPPKLTIDQTVTPVDLEAIPWATNGKNGVAFRAKALNPVVAQKPGG